MRLSHKQSFSDIKRPGSARGFRPSSSISSSRPSSSMGSRPSTPGFARADPYNGSITVSIRPNPLNSENNSSWEISPDSNSITNIQDSTCFQFDHVFPASKELSNRDVYQSCCAHIVSSFLNDGYNSTLFAYGMTGSGKTYSMKGDLANPGFIKLAIDDIFDLIENDISKQYTLSVSYLEIYNEKIVDLLNSNMSSDIKIRDDPDYGVRLMGINCPVVSSRESLLLLIASGDTRRKTSATDFNTRSSRSHAILQLKLHTQDSSSDGSSSNHRTLSLCDLAGSERATSCAERRKEGAFINKSLLALSTVINKLSLSSSANHPVDHIPYRDSKLTRLLQPALSGLSLILILCNVQLGLNSPSLTHQFTTETLNTLRFAARAKDIVISVRQNNLSRKGSLADAETLKMIEDLKKTVESQKLELNLLRVSNTLPSTSLQHPMQTVQANADVKILQEKLDHLTRLSDIHKTETVLLRNDALNDILGMDIDKNAQQSIMSNLEEFYKRMSREVDEYKSYNNLLEQKLRDALQQVALLANSSCSNSTKKSGSDKHYESVLRDQEEEIWNLKESLKDKDSIIHSLTKTSKLRRLVDSSNTPSFSPDAAKRKPFTISSLDKENLSHLAPEY